MNIITKKRALRMAAFLLCLLLLAGPAFTQEACAAYEPPQALKLLWELNKDVIGGLNIPGTSICYPILQHPSVDDYYLNVCFDGTAGYPGSIYTNSMEGKSFSTFNTVIYGRNTGDDSYFGSLKNYLDIEYLDAHRQIEIYGADKKHSYTVFAAVIYDDRRITDFYTDGEIADQLAFIESLRLDALPGSILLDDVDVDAGLDRIITLSTGITGRPDNRLLVVAVER